MDLERKAVIIFVTAGLKLNMFCLTHYLSKGNVSKVVFIVDKKNPPHKSWGKATIEELKKLISGAYQTVEFDKKVREIDPTDYEDAFVGVYETVQDLIANRCEAIIDFTSATSVAILAAMNVAILTGCSLSIVKSKEHLVLPEKDWKLSYEKRAQQEGESVLEIPLPKLFQRIGHTEESLLAQLFNQTGKSDSITELIRGARKEIKRTEPAPVSRIKFYYQLKKLERGGLIKMDREARATKIELTDAGRVLAKALTSQARQANSSRKTG